MKKSGTEKLIQYIFEKRKELCTASMREMARLCLLDELGCCIYGSRMPEAKKILEAAGEGLESGRAFIWGTEKAFSPSTAALVNGSFCHMRELDDVHFAILHTGAVCVPAALAVAQICNSTIEELLDAVIIGVEVMVRIALGMDFLNHRERGWHGTATCGPFGAAAAAGVLLGLGQEEMVNALGIAGSRTGGTWAFAKDGAMTKRLHPGMAARDGVMAAFFARQGLKGPHYVLEAEDGGLYRIMSESWSLEPLGREARPALEDIEFKWFASCKSVHSPFSAALQIYENNPRQRFEELQELHVYVNRSAIEMAGGQYQPDSVVSAQISIPYGVALGIHGYSGTAEDYTEKRMQDENLRQTAAMVQVHESPEMNRLRREENRSAARVEVRWKNGEEAKAFVKSPKGSMYSPLTREDIIKKYASLTREILGAEKSEAVCTFILQSKEKEKLDVLSCIFKEVGNGK